MSSDKSNDGMDENVSTNEEELLILPLNDKNSKKLSQIISNDTARDVLEAIASNPLSASEIAEKLGIPLTTVQYNLEKLNDVGLVKVERTRYSKKMKHMKIYAPQRKFVIIVPEKKTSRSEVIAALKMLLTMTFFAVVGFGVIEFLAMKIKGPELEGVIRAVQTEKGGVPAPEGVFDVAYGFDIFAHPGLWFLFGSLFVIIAVFLMQYYRIKCRK